MVMLDTGPAMAQHLAAARQTLTHFVLSKVLPRTSTVWQHLMCNFYVADVNATFFNLLALWCRFCTSRHMSWLPSPMAQQVDLSPTGQAATLN